MNIVHLITSIEKGGAENHLSCLVRGQVKKNKVIVIYLKGKPYWKKYFLGMGVKTIKLSFKNNNLIEIIKNTFYLKKIFKDFKIDVVHSHLPHMEFYGWLSTLFQKKIKFVISKHVANDFFGGSEFVNKSLFAMLLCKIFASRAKKIISISNTVKKYFSTGIISINKKKIETIYYGIDKDYINTITNNKKKIFLPKNKLIFGSVGRLVKQKNYKFVIKSFEKYHKLYNVNSILVIAGKGPEEKNLKRLVNELKLKNNIFFIGHLNNVANFLKQIDVFCMNSKFEGLGLVMLEAMAFGKPIIAPRISAIPEVIKDGVNGLLTKSDDINSYVNAMKKAQNYNLRKKLSKQNKLYLKNKFSFDKMISKTQNIYIN